MPANLKTPSIDLEQIRRAAISALCSDDELLDLLVLKGGNALTLIYKVGSRASLDLDYSMEGDIENVAAIKVRLDKTVEKTFATMSLQVFDTKLEERPKLGPGQTMYKNWGGYQYTFKLITKKLAAELKNNLTKMQGQAVTVTPDLKRTFKIDISRHEFCEPKQEVEWDDLRLFVYSPEMLAAEKLRAICQQNSDYLLRRHPAPRARDFFDIHTIVEKLEVDVSKKEFAELLKSIFAAKSVPIEYLRTVETSREFHRHDWPSVADSIKEKHHEFDYYFDFVVKLIARIPLE